MSKEDHAHIELRYEYVCIQMKTLTGNECGANLHTQHMPKLLRRAQYINMKLEKNKWVYIFVH